MRQFDYQISSSHFKKYNRQRHSLFDHNSLKMHNYLLSLKGQEQEEFILIVILNLMFGSSIKDRKNKEIYQNGTAFRSFAVFDEANPSHRQYMEDQSFIYDCFLENCPKSALFGIFDGHGGFDVSKFLVKTLPQIIKDTHSKMKKRGKTLFQQSFDIADKKILELDLEAGSTGTVCLLTLEQAKRVLYVAHVGDSSAYLFDDNNFEKLTPQHRCDNQAQVLRVKEAGGKILMGRLGGLLAITRAFGDLALKKNMGLIARPEVKKVEIRLNHRFVIVASDGIWDFVNPKSIQKILKQQEEPDVIAKTLIKMALVQGSIDNISVIVVKL